MAVALVVVELGLGFDADVLGVEGEERDGSSVCMFVEDEFAPPLARANCASMALITSSNESRAAFLPTTTGGGGGGGIPEPERAFSLLVLADAVAG